MIADANCSSGSKTRIRVLFFDFFCFITARLEECLDAQFVSNACFLANAKNFSPVGTLGCGVRGHRGAMSYLNRFANSRRLIFPRSVVGIESTIKIRFGTCHALNAVRQNSISSFSRRSEERRVGKECRARWAREQ